MKGTIEKVWENESRNGQPYLAVQIDGERYSVWDQKYFDHMKEGAEIEYDFRQSGDFKNITDVQGGNGPDAGDDGFYTNHRDRQITRLSCLKSAAEIIAPVHLDPDLKRDLVIGTSRAFERYVAEGDLTGGASEDGDGDAGND